MTRGLVESLLGAQRRESPETSLVVFEHPAGQYTLSFHEDRVAIVHSMPLNAQAVSPKVIAALTGDSAVPVRPTGLPVSENPGAPQTGSSRITFTEIMGGVLFLVVIAVACFFRPTAIIVEVVGLVIVGLVVLFFGLMFSPAGWVVLALQFMGVLLGGRVDSPDPPPTIAGFFLYWIFTAVTMLGALLIGVVLICCGEPKGGVLEYVREVGRKDAEKTRLLREQSSPLTPGQEDRPTEFQKSASKTQSSEVGSHDGVANKGVAKPTPKVTKASDIEGAVFRQWKDSSGKFSKEARLLGIDAEHVRLETRTGSVINVSVEKLSEEDKAWLKVHRATDTPEN